MYEMLSLHLPLICSLAESLQQPNPKGRHYHPSFINRELKILKA